MRIGDILCRMSRVVGGGIPLNVHSWQADFPAQTPRTGPIESQCSGTPPFCPVQYIAFFAPPPAKTRGRIHESISFRNSPIYRGMACSGSSDASYSSTT